MTRRHSRSIPFSGFTVLLVDDSQQYLDSTSSLLERRGHRVLTASSGRAAIDCLRREHVDLVLLDFFMPGMTGEEVVKELRTFNPYAQVVLQTGFAGEEPAIELLDRLDIQGYFDKSEGPDKLLLWTQVGLKAAHMVHFLQKSRQGLQYILNVTPELHKVQPLRELYQGILLQLAGLIDAVGSFLVLTGSKDPPHDEAAKTHVDSFLALLRGDDAHWFIQAATGRFRDGQKLGDLPKETTALIHSAFETGKIQIENGNTVVPLAVGDEPVGFIYIDRPTIQRADMDLLQLFANQAAVAVQKTKLYELATVDQLTQVYVRRIFDQFLDRELRSAFRAERPLALIMVDLDDMKGINDSAGHLAGDSALKLVGDCLRRATRSTDVVARYGGDEFVAILPHISASGARVVADRIVELVRTESIARGEPARPVTVSVGVTSLLPPHSVDGRKARAQPTAYFESAAKELVRRADEALYAAKRDGRDRVREAEPEAWPPLLVSREPR
jgi:diguanylate cyclase (GGDEF)-like protein